MPSMNPPRPIPSSRPGSSGGRSARSMRGGLPEANGVSADQGACNDRERRADQADPSEETLEWPTVTDAFHQQEGSEMAEVDQEESAGQEIAQRTPSGKLNDGAALFFVLVGAGSRKQDERDRSEDRNRDPQPVLLPQRRKVSGEPSALLAALCPCRSCLAALHPLSFPMARHLQFSRRLFELPVDPVQKLLFRISPLVFARMGNDEDALRPVLEKLVADR